MNLFFKHCLGSLLAMLLLTIFSAVANAQLTNIQYFTDSDGNGGLIITGFAAAGSGPLVIPDTINGLPVTGIDGQTFYHYTDDYYQLTSVTIPSSVTTIGIGTFSSSFCSSLTSITVSAQNPAFSSSVDGVLFNESQTILMECPAGKTGSYTIPNSVTSIGGKAFYACTGLTSVTIPNSVTNIDNSAFLACTGFTSVTIPDSVTNIGNDAFGLCFRLTSMTIPDSVTSIGDKAFYNCFGLISMTIGSGVTNIGNQVFTECKILTSITVSPQNIFFSSVNGVLFNNNQTTLIQYPEAKAGNNYTIPDGVTSIGDEAFYFCPSLTSVTIPNSVTSIGDSAFEYCSGLTSVTIPNNVTSIGASVFHFCTGLTSVIIPNSVTSIGNDAFLVCSNLSSVHFLGNAPVMGSYVFRSAGSGFTVSYYKGATGFTSPTWTDSSGDSYPALVLPDPTFNQWEASYPTLTDLSPTDTPENDGMPTLFKYLYDINPARLMTAADRAALPVLAMTGEGDLTLTFRKYSLQTGITLNVQTSTDLQTWTTATQVTNPTAGCYTLQPTGAIDPNTGDPYMKIDFKPGSASSRLFIRLNATMP